MVIYAQLTSSSDSEEELLEESELDEEEEDEECLTKTQWKQGSLDLRLFACVKIGTHDSKIQKVTISVDMHRERERKRGREHDCVCVCVCQSFRYQEVAAFF